MEPLFKNKTTLSKESYLTLLKFHQKKNNCKYFLYTTMFFILFIIIVAFQVANKIYFQAILFFILFIAFLLYRFINPYYKTDKELKSDKIKNNIVNYYFFYEKYFRIKNELGNDKIKYHKLYRIYESENYFYLYLDKYNVFIIDKSGFTFGTAVSFEKFIKDKTWFKFRKD